MWKKSVVGNNRARASEFVVEADGDHVDISITLRVEEALITVNVALMRTQTSNSFVHHLRLPGWDFIEIALSLTELLQAFLTSAYGRCF
jgi:hypothetical protein